MINIMLDFAQKRKVRSVLYHPIMLTALLVIVVFFLHSTWVVYGKKRESEAMAKASAAHVEELQARDADMKAKIERLGTETGLEEEIRSKFSVVKGGENMVIVVDGQNGSSGSATSTDSWWRKLLHFFYK